MVKVYHKNQLINWRIHKDSFPDIETSFKGDGYFDFEVEPLSFKVNKKGLNIQVNDIVVITDEQGRVIINGYIDAIGDELSNPVEVTVYPQSLKLKDITAGQEVLINEDPDNEETAVDYVTAGYKSVREIVAELAKQASQETGWSFNTNESAVPDPSETKHRKRYFGTVLDEIPLGKISLSEEFFYFRGKDGILYFISDISGLRMETLIPKSAFNFSIIVPWNDWPALGVKKGSWLNQHLIFPSSDIKAPATYPAADVSRCEYGGLTYIDRVQRFVEAGEETRSISKQLKNKYGERLNTIQYENIQSEDALSAILDEMGYKLKNVIALIDTDSFNSYALVEAKKKFNDLFGRYLFISLENSTEFYYEAHYRNTPVMDILKDLAIITDRYLYIDPNNTICLLPRAGYYKSVTVNRADVLEIKKTTSNQDDISITVNRFTENQEGEAESYGLKLRDNEWSYREKSLNEKFTGKKETYDWKIINKGSVIDLTKEVFMGGAGYGVIIKIKRNKIEKTIEFTTEKYNV